MSSTQQARHRSKMIRDTVTRCRLLAAHGARSCLSVRTQPPTVTGAPSQTSTIQYQTVADRLLCIKPGHIPFLSNNQVATTMVKRPGIEEAWIQQSAAARANAGTHNSRTHTAGLKPTFLAATLAATIFAAILTTNQGTFF